jgi:hypothetical protein
MANRTTVKSNIIALNVPSVDNAELNLMLNGELADNVVFKDAVVAVQVSTISNITCDFTGKDRIELTRTGGTLVITPTNLPDGSPVYLFIHKTAGYAVTFTIAVDQTEVQAYVTATTNVLYEIIQKGSVRYARAFLRTVKTATDSIEGVLPIASAAEVAALTILNKSVVPGRIPLATDSQKGVIEVALPAENDAGTAGNLAVIASELKRKYDAALVAAAAASTAYFAANYKVKGFGRYNFTAGAGSGQVLITHNLGLVGTHYVFLTLGEFTGVYGAMDFGAVPANGNAFDLYWHKTNASNPTSGYINWVIFQ